MIIRYTFKHTVDGDFQTQYFTLDEIENGNSKEYVYFMKENGYIVANKTFEKYI